MGLVKHEALQTPAVNLLFNERNELLVPYDSFRAHVEQVDPPPASFFVNGRALCGKHGGIHFCGGQAAVLQPTHLVSHQCLERGDDYGEATLYESRQLERKALSVSGREK